MIEPIEDLVVQLSADTRRFSGQIEGALGKSLTAFAGFGTRVDGIVAKWGKTAALAAAAASAAMVAASSKMAISFEKGMAEVRTLVPKLSEEVFGQMEKDILSLSREMGIATNELVPALYQAISAGVAPAEVIGFLRENIKLAVGGVTDLKTAVDLTTTILNAFGMSMNELTRVSDVMFSAMAGGKTTIAELGGALFNVAPVAAQLGVSIEEVAAALATLTATGTPTTVATTQLRQAILALAAPTAEQLKLMDELGIKIDATTIAENGLAWAMNEILTAAAGNNTVLRRLVGSTEAIQAVMVLGGTGAAKYASELDKATKSAGGTEEAFAIMEATMSRKWQRTWNRFKVTLTEFGIRTLPALEKALRGFNWALERLGQGISFVTRYWELFAAALLMAFGGPVGIFHTLALLVVRWDEIWKKLPEPAKVAMDKVGDAVEATANGVMRAFSTAINWIIGRLNWLVERAEWVANKIGQIAKFEVSWAIPEVQMPRLPQVFEYTPPLRLAEEWLAEIDHMLDLAKQMRQQPVVPPIPPPPGLEETAGELDELTEAFLRLASASGISLDALGQWPMVFDLALRAARRLGWGGEELEKVFTASGKAFGDFARRLAAAEALNVLRVQVERAVGALDELRSAFTGLFMKPTIEEARIQEQLAKLRLRRARAVMAGATAEELAAIDREIQQIENIVAVRQAENDLMEARLDIADKTLLSDADRLVAARDLIVEMWNLSAAAVPLIQLYRDQAEAMRGWMTSLAAWVETLTAAPLPTEVRGYQQGGVVPGPYGQPQLAVVHGGETVLPAGRGGWTVTVPLNLTLQGFDRARLRQILSRELDAALLQAEGKSYRAGHPLSSAIE